MRAIHDAESTKSERLTITLADDQRRRITAIARQRRTSAATVIRWAVDKYLGSNDETTNDGPRHDHDGGGAE